MRGFLYSYITLLWCVLYFEWSTQYKINMRIPAADVQALRNHAVTCEKETGVAAALLRKAIDWPFPNDELNMKFLYCVCYKTGYADKDGHAVPENLGAFPVVNGTQKEHLKVIKQCNEITLADPFETFFAVGNCLHSSIVYSV